MIFNVIFALFGAALCLLGLLSTQAMMVGHVAKTRRYLWCATACSGLAWILILTRP